MCTCVSLYEKFDIFSFIRLRKKQKSFMQMNVCPFDTLFFCSMIWDKMRIRLHGYHGGLLSWISSPRQKNKITKKKKKHSLILWNVALLKREEWHGHSICLSKKKKHTHKLFLYIFNSAFTFFWTKSHSSVCSRVLSLSPPRYWTVNICTSG